MNIHILVVPESEQREEVNGADWFFDEKGDLQVRISPMKNWRREVALGLHEAFEGLACKHLGIPFEAVDAFDAKYDKTHTFDTDAGDEPVAPYSIPHSFATAVERIWMAMCGENWKEYDNELKASYPGPSKKNK